MILTTLKETRKNKTSFFFIFLNIIEFEKALHHNQNDCPDVAIGQQKATAFRVWLYTTRLASMYTFYLFCFPCFVHGMMMAHRARSPSVIFFFSYIHVT